MVAVRLEEDALDFVAGQLADGDSLSAAFRREALWEPVVFLPDFVDPLTLPALDVDAGWVGSQEGAVAELASYLLFLKKRDGRLHSLIFNDPWATLSDLDYAGPPPDELLMLQGRVNYLQDIARTSPELIWQYRDVAVSYLKIVYVSELTEQAIRDMVEEEPDDLLDRLAQSVRHIVVNAYDDETWVIVRHEPRPD